MDLEAYLARIGFRGAPRTDEATLFALHEAHLAAIPYENIDIQLGQPKALDEDRFEQRLVHERRGGWCYEMNGLLSAALRTIGFRVHRHAGTILRDVLGDATAGHHMVLTVALDGRTFVADVGLGDGPVHPFPLEAGTWTENGFTYALERTEDRWWRFHNHAHGLAPRFDFQQIPRELEWYREPFEWLQSTEESVFRGLAMVFRRDATRVRALRDLTYLDIVGPEKTETRLQTLDAFGAKLGELLDFDDASAITRLWEMIHPRVAARAAARTE